MADFGGGGNRIAIILGQNLASEKTVERGDSQSKKETIVETRPLKWLTQDRHCGQDVATLKTGRLFEEATSVGWKTGLVHNHVMCAKE